MLPRPLSKTSQDTTEYHYPGTNYLGPGTNVEKRIRRGDQPTSYIDKIARQHDVDFLISNGSMVGGLMDNIRAISKAYLNPLSLQSMAMRLGLSAENLLRIISFGNIQYNTKLPGRTQEETRNIGLSLDKYINH